MLLNLSHIGQIALPVLDTDRAEAFYENVIGLRKLYRFGDLSFLTAPVCAFCSTRRQIQRNSDRKAASTSAAPTSR
jgi:catechol 2,3-dioxygenase-like lactoylglutathione lyase family enzyme